MNAQIHRGGISSTNSLASILGTTLYRGASCVDSSSRGEMLAKHHAKTHHGLKSILKRRR